MSRLRIISPGPRTTVQDHGRPGNASLGVGRSGAADRDAHDLANRIVGNATSAATLEMTLGGLALLVDRSTWLAVSGPHVTVTVDGVEVGTHTAFFAPAASVIRVATPARGMRCYLAVRGGIGVAPLLGSRSTDTLGGIGPDPLHEGDVLHIGSDIAGDIPGVDIFPAGEPADIVELVVDPGPRIDWFTDSAWSYLLTTAYTVAADSDRIGVRLDGPPLERARDGELPSEGLMQGAVQIPPVGTPVCFLADTPTTGGYPVIAVVRRSSLSALAQARPGQTVRFRSG